MMIQKTLVSAALVLSAMGAQASTNLVNNGSFEANAQTVNHWTIYSNLTDWSGGAAGIELRNNVAGVAQEGVNFVELDTTNNSSMSQQITFANAGSYVLSFWYAARPDNGTRNTNSDALGWALGNSFSGAVLGNWALPGATTWQHFTTTFTIGQAGTQTLAFNALGISDSYGGSIDNVSITSAVPEPESYALMLVGLGLMGTMVRRRSK